MEALITPFKASRKWALVGISILTVVLATALLTGWFEFTSSQSRKYYMLIGGVFVTSILCNICAQLYFRKHNESLMTFGEGFSISMFMGILAAVSMGIITYLLLTMTLPEEAAIVGQGDEDSPEIRLPIPISFSISGMVFFYFLFTGLFTTLFIKKG